MDGEDKDELLTHGKAGFFQASYRQGKSGNFLEVLQKVTPAYMQQLSRSHVHSSARYMYHQSSPKQGQACLRLLSKLIQVESIKEEMMSYADSIRYQGIEGCIYA